MTDEAVELAGVLARRYTTGALGLLGIAILVSLFLFWYHRRRRG